MNKSNGWGICLGGRAFAQLVQGLRFDSQHHQRERKGKKRRKRTELRKIEEYFLGEGDSRGVVVEWNRKGTSKSACKHHSLPVCFLEKQFPGELSTALSEVDRVSSWG